MNKKLKSIVTVGGGRLTIEDVVAVAVSRKTVALPRAKAFRKKIRMGSDFLSKSLKDGVLVYGVNTGYGDNCTTLVPEDLVAKLPDNLVRYHGVGTGHPLDAESTRAVLVCRLNSLSFGLSGVRPELLELLIQMVNRNVLPVIPSEGSVGASGDLTPLSYVAATMTGKRRAIFNGKVIASLAALKKAKLKPIELAPKEGLALMNGTAVMTGLACLAYDRAAYLSRVASRITSMVSYAIDGNAEHFDKTLFDAKPHRGQQLIAARLRTDLDYKKRAQAPRIQDRYSVRCAPHVIGVLEDALTWVRRDLENEVNSTNDNPLIDPVGKRILHGGHFYGGHVGFAMDALKLAVANVADLLDRQMALIVDARYNHGLPANLVDATSQSAAIQHGFKALQISCSAWTAEALKLTMPATAFSRSTECHNQDKVSMGTIAARDCIRILELTEQVAAAMLLAATQGVMLRSEIKGAAAPSRTLMKTVNEVVRVFGRQREDRELDAIIDACVRRILEKKVPAPA